MLVFLIYRKYKFIIIEVPNLDQHTFLTFCEKPWEYFSKKKCELWVSSIFYSMIFPLILSLFHFIFFWEKLSTTLNAQRLIFSEKFSFFLSKLWHFLFTLVFFSDSLDSLLKKPIEKHINLTFSKIYNIDNIKSTFVMLQHMENFPKIQTLIQ